MVVIVKNITDLEGVLLALEIEGRNIWLKSNEKETKYIIMSFTQARNMSEIWQQVIINLKALTAL